MRGSFIVSPEEHVIWAEQDIASANTHKWRRAPAPAQGGENRPPSA
jgi:hypothetical protein